MTTITNPKRFIDDTVARASTLSWISTCSQKKFDTVYPDTVGVLVLPPSIEALKERLEHRKTDSPDVINLRIANAEKEMAFARQHGKYEYTVVNADLEKAKADVVAIVK